MRDERRLMILDYCGKDCKYFKKYEGEFPNRACAHPHHKNIKFIHDRERKFPLFCPLERKVKYCNCDRCLGIEE